MGYSYSPEIIDAAMKMWAQSGGVMGWTDIARRLHEVYGVKVSANTVKSWHDKGVPIDWHEFRDRFNARLYENQAKRLAEEAAEVREQTWIALRSMFKILSKEVQRYAEGDLHLKWRSADALINSFLSVVKEYHRIFGDPTKEIQALIEAMPESAREQLRQELESVEPAASPAEA